ncbi:MAG: hypothetical protein LKE51_03205 [Selenomonas sp.]|jgi:hypothetical protein|nr:hypothetical protein [Selenomonas sp.]
MKKQKQLAWIIAFALTTGNLSFVQAQSAVDFEDAEYISSHRAKLRKRGGLVSGKSSFTAGIMRLWSV